MSTQPPVDPTRCPLCGQRNDCGMSCTVRRETCWCVKVEFGESLLARIPEEAKARACICRRCAEASTLQTSSTA